MRAKPPSFDIKLFGRIRRTKNGRWADLPPYGPLKAVTDPGKVNSRTRIPLAYLSNIVR